MTTNKATDAKLARANADDAAAAALLAVGEQVAEAFDRRTQVLRGWIAALTVVAMLLGADAVVGYIGHRDDAHRIDSNTAVNRNQHAEIEELRRSYALLDDAIRGCVAKRGQAQTGLVVLALENDNRKIHHVPAKAAPPELIAAASMACPGDVGAPPVTAQATTTTTNPTTTTPRRNMTTPTTHTGSTASVGGSRPTPGPTTTTTACVVAPICIAGACTPCA